jgi:hypothetical protein
MMGYWWCWTRSRRRLRMGVRVSARMGVRTAARTAQRMAEWAGVRVVQELAGRERHGSGVEDTAAEADEGDDEDDLQRIAEVIGDLRCDYVEAEDEGEREAEDGGGAEQRVDADEGTEGEAPGELLRGGSATEKGEDGKGDAAIGPTVVRECLIQRHM